MAPKAGVSKHWPFDTYVDPTFLTGLSSILEILPINGRNPIPWKFPGI
jgi:hypothetical protein